jgi:SpoVK/Ycf46/Vps4 family AAA+-type ATPase
MEDPVVITLRAAIIRSDSPELRTALADHFLKVAQPREALAEAEAGLERFPAATELLAVAARAARALGQDARATAYELARNAHEHRPDPGARQDNERGEQEPALTDVGSTQQEMSVAREVKQEVRLRLVTDADLPATPPITLASVAGLEPLKQLLQRKFLAPLRDPELHRRFGKKVRGGLLLYGPPGCGKTYIARALAGELGARFLHVGLTDVFTMWLGESERNLHELFQNARRSAPAVLFLDEVDALGQRRSNLRGSAGRNVVNQLLAELDGVGASNDGLFVLAATNHPWDVDTALRRPGRFDRLVFVPPPDAPARSALLASALASRPLAQSVNLARLAEAAEEYSGADLVAVVELATELAIEATQSLATEQSIDDRLLRRALDETRPSTRPWLELARHHAIYANEGGIYDELLDYLRERKLA